MVVEDRFAAVFENHPRYRCDSAAARGRAADVCAHTLPESARRNAQRAADAAFRRAVPRRIRNLPAGLDLQHSDPDRAGDARRIARACIRPSIWRRRCFIWACRSPKFRARTSNRRRAARSMRRVSALRGDSSIGCNAGEDLAVRSLSGTGAPSRTIAWDCSRLHRRARRRSVAVLSLTTPLPGAPLGEIVRLMRDAAFFAGNDSGPAHVAAAFGVPQIVLFGPSDSEVWAPWRTPAEILKAEGRSAISRSSGRLKRWNDCGP